MSRFKATLYTANSRDHGVREVGTYMTKEQAAEEAYKYAHDNGFTSSCDRKDEVLDALLTRDYYMLAYGPRELELTEVESK